MQKNCKFKDKNQTLKITNPWKDHFQRRKERKIKMEKSFLPLSKLITKKFSLWTIKELRDRDLQASK